MTGAFPHPPYWKVRRAGANVLDGARGGLIYPRRNANVNQPPGMCVLVINTRIKNYSGRAIDCARANGER